MSDEFYFGKPHFGGSGVVILQQSGGLGASLGAGFLVHLWLRYHSVNNAVRYRYIIAEIRPLSYSL